MPIKLKRFNPDPDSDEPTPGTPLKSRKNEKYVEVIAAIKGMEAAKKEEIEEQRLTAEKIDAQVVESTRVPIKKLRRFYRQGTSLIDLAELYGEDALAQDPELYEGYLAERDEMSYEEVEDDIDTTVEEVKWIVPYKGAFESRSS